MTTAPVFAIPDAQFWAKGCDRCAYGIAHPVPALRHDRPLYQERLAQHHAGDLRLCDCAAGLLLADWLSDAGSSERQYKDTIDALPAKLAQRRNETIFANAGIPARYAAYTLEGFVKLVGDDPGKREAIDALRHYHAHGSIRHGGEERPGIILWGRPGTGKTGSLSPLFTALVRGGASGLWLQYNELMAEMKRFEDGQVDARMAACQSVAYLFIDDLGDPSATRAATDYTRDVLFRIIDYRVSRNMAIFVTTNLTPQSMITQFDERITRRLFSICATFQMEGKILR